ncbi:MAG TPA: cytochrome d ubiquinol oxidase subunit II [Spirochaetia bacterium]|nr:cytochrome d ubiquinol oxidase subunit II [Spirochaetia bacterium]
MGEQAGAFLPAVWFAILGFILLLYTLLDGFDLGVGIISLLVKDEQARGILMGSLGSIWDANETWLVLFGGIIFGAFPAVYGLVMTALYIPLVGMLVGLIFRAVSFEFRAHSVAKRPWVLAFGWGSLLTAVSQGFAFGGLLWGVNIQNGAYVGGVFDWFSPFSILTAVAVVGGYAMFGSTYIVMKTRGGIADMARRTAGWGAGIAALGALLDTVLAVAKYPFLSQKWGSTPGSFLTIIPFALGVAAFGMMLLAIKGRREALPFICALIFAFFSYVALSANYFPIIVPPALTVYQTAAQPLTLRSMLVAVGIALPILLAYNILQYWIFRGKTTSSPYEEE